ACGSNNDSEDNSAYVCDWIDRDVIVSVIGNDGFVTRGDLASSLDDSLKISDCHVVTDTGDKIITINYTGFTPDFKTKSHSIDAQEHARQKWKDGGPKIPDDKKQLVPLDGYVIGTAYPTDHYVHASVVTDHEFISVIIF